jgi:type VI secretion system protein VasD
LQGAIKATQTTNPDVRGRPSPVVVRIYELRTLGAFNSADFFSLFEKEAETLGGDLVGREEYDLQPGETRPYRRQLQPDTKFIGVAAAFRDLEKARWRQAAPVPAKRGVALTIGVEALAVTMVVK